MCVCVWKREVKQKARKKQRETFRNKENPFLREKIGLFLLSKTKQNRKKQNKEGWFRFK